MMHGLGQFGADEPLHPGRPFILSFRFQGGWTGGPLLGDIRSALASWAPFSTAKLTLMDVTSGGNLIVMTVAANLGSEVFRYGGIGAAIADRLNQSLGNWGIVLAGINQIGQAAIPGTGTTTFSTQFREAGGITFTPWAPVTPQSGASWIPFALLGGAALITLFLVE